MNRAAQKSVAMMVSGKMTVTKLPGAGPVALAQLDLGDAFMKTCFQHADPLSLNFIDCCLFE